MRPTTHLPEGWQLLRRIDLAANKKEAVLVNSLALLIGAVLLFAGMTQVPFGAIGELPNPWLGLLVMAAGSVAYLFLHEVVHGVFFRLFGRQKVQYGFCGLYAWAGSRVWFDKKRYLVIGLAPVVVWGIVLALVLMAVPRGWFWPFYLIELQNLAGAAGDLYVAALLLRMPDDILVQDAGISMEIYGPAFT